MTNSDSIPLNGSSESLKFNILGASMPTHRLVYFENYLSSQIIKDLVEKTYSAESSSEVAVITATANNSDFQDLFANLEGFMDAYVEVFKNVYSANLIITSTFNNKTYGNLYVNLPDINLVVRTQPFDGGFILVFSKEGNINKTREL